MLSYLDGQVAVQENSKDVRCWSSVCKIQMFLSGVPIEQEAIGVRVERHVELIHSVWEEAARLSKGATISKETLASILESRFPHQVENESKFIFNFSGQVDPIEVQTGSIIDYSDTIEGWRLLQTWATRRTDESGHMTLTPTFSEPALNAFHDFLLVYDIALLRHARAIASERKLPKVDAESMNLAFSAERQPRKS